MPAMAAGPSPWGSSGPLVISTEQALTFTRRLSANPPKGAPAIRSSSGNVDDRKAGGSGSRSYRMQKHARGSLWHQLGALNPLLLLDRTLPILHPASRARVIWDVAMLWVVLYVAVVAPLKISFVQFASLLSLHILDWVVTSFLALDVIVNFRTAYISSRGELVRDSRLIALRYLRGMFLLDVAAALPFVTIFAYTAETRYDHYTVWLALLKLVPLLRLIRLLVKGSGFFGNSLAMVRLLILMLLVAHWTCCFWHFLSEAIPEWPWMFTVRCSECEPGQHYLLGFYAAFLLLLGDRPSANNNLERAVVTSLLFMGTLLYAVVVGSMTLLVANMWAMASRHKQRAVQVDDALRYRGASPEVRAQVGEYFAHLGRFQHPGSDGVAFLQELPVGLYNSVMASMFGPRLGHVQLFAHCEKPFLNRLASHLRLSLHMPGDMIYDVGSVGHDMYIIWTGAVMLLSPAGCMLALMTDGDHFGELGLMSASMPRPHRATAARPSDVMLLSRWDLQDAMKDYPDSAALVKYRARSRVEDHEAINLSAFVVGWDPFMLDGGGGMLRDDDAYEHPAAGVGEADAGSNAVFRRRQRQAREQLQRQKKNNATKADAAGDGGLPDGGLGRGPVGEALEASASMQPGRWDGPAGSDGGNDPSEEQPPYHPTAQRAPAAGSSPSGRKLKGVGQRLANFLRLGGSKARPARVSRADDDTDEEDPLAPLVAPSGLSIRGPSCAVLQRPGPTLTATQRRSMALPAGGADEQVVVGGQGAEARGPQAWGARHSVEGRRGSVCELLPQQSSIPVVRIAKQVSIAPSAGPGGRLQRQRSRHAPGLWLDSLKVEDVNEVDAVGGPTADSPSSQQAANLVGPFAVGQNPSTGGASHRPRRQSGRTSMQLQQLRGSAAPGLAVSPSRTLQHASSTKRLSMVQRHTGLVNVTNLPGPGLPPTRTNQPPSPLPYQPYQPPPPPPQQPLPTLDDVWRQIQKAAIWQPSPDAHQHRPVSPRSSGQGRDPLQPGAGAMGSSTLMPAAHGSLAASSGLGLAGSGTHSLPKLFSQGLDSGAEAGDAVMSLVITTRSSLGAFPVGLPPGIPSPAPRSPKVSATGCLTPGAGGRVGYRAALDASNLGSPAPGGGSHFNGNTRLHHNVSIRGPRSSTGYSHHSLRSGGPSAGMYRGSCEGEAVALDDDWSSDSSDGENRRLVAALRQQLGEANARVLLLESQLTAVILEPLKVPAIAAVVQDEVHTALLRVGIAVDARLAGMRDMLQQILVRTEELSQQVLAADDRLQRLENEDNGGLPASASTAAIATASVGGAGAGGSLMNLPLEMMAARSSDRTRSSNGAHGGAIMAFNAPEFPPRMGSSYLNSVPEVGDWRRTLTAGSVSNGGKRPGVSRAPSVPVQGILKAPHASSSGSRWTVGAGLDRDWQLLVHNTSPSQLELGGQSRQGQAGAAVGGDRDASARQTQSGAAPAGDQDASVRGGNRGRRPPPTATGL